MVAGLEARARETEWMEGGWMEREGGERGEREGGEG